MHNKVVVVGDKEYLRFLNYRALEQTLWGSIALRYLVNITKVLPIEVLMPRVPRTSMYIYRSREHTHTCKGCFLSPILSCALFLMNCISE